MSTITDIDVYSNDLIKKAIYEYDQNKMPYEKTENNPKTLIRLCAEAIVRHGFYNQKKNEPNLPEEVENHV